MSLKYSCSNKKYKQIKKNNYYNTKKLRGKFVALYLIKKHVQVIVII